MSNGNKTLMTGILNKIGTTLLVAGFVILAGLVIVGTPNSIKSKAATGAPTNMVWDSSTVLIGQAAGGHGSGVLISPTEVLTASHVFVNAQVQLGAPDQFIVTTIDGVPHKVIKAKTQKTTDLAVLTLDKPITNQTPVETRCTRVKIREQLWTTAHPFSMTFVTLPLRVAAYMQNVPLDLSLHKGKTKTQMIDDAVLLEGVIVAGMSGGGVTDERGKLVGILSMQFTGDRQEFVNLGAMIPSSAFPQCEGKRQ